MSNSLVDFLRSNPFWAVFIIIFMVLPIVGAVIHILLKAFGRRGIDNAPTLTEDATQDDKSLKSDGAPSNEKNQPSQPDKKI